MNAFAAALLLATAAPAGAAAPPAATAAASGPIDPARLSAIVKTLASDEFQGRGPGTEGEAKTIDYLSKQLAALGLAPGGENGGWTQTVPLIRTQIALPNNVDISGRDYRLGDEIYVSTVRPVDRAVIEKAPMVFVGYGVSAPERGWDDFKGVDLKGKVAVFLVNDPDFEAASSEPVAGKFGGQAMTYYGRWTYKYEEAARRGAIAALIVHQTDAAGYGWETVAAPGGENYDIVRPADAPKPILLQGWIQGDAAADLFRRSGLDLAVLKREARTAAFRPVELKGAFLSANLPVKHTTVQSHNVLARIPGAKRPDETVMFSAHWDAYGIGPADAEGRTVRPGAADDAIGVAGVLEIARAFKEGPKPDRSLVFALWTAEERGLLGSEYYAVHPLYPLDKTVANLTMDVLQTAGPARDVLLIGQGQSNLEDDLARAAAAQGRVITPDAHPERGLFYRADHFSLAKRGVPVLLLMGLGGGADLVEGGRAAGEQWLADYMKCYHQTCDTWSADWDLRGAAQDVALLYTIGKDLAFSDRWPEWRPTSEFKAIREKTAAARD